MNIQRLIAVVIAVAINCAVLVWFNGSGTTTVASATSTPAAARVKNIPTLPTITVWPTPAEIQWLRRHHMPVTPRASQVGATRSV